ncbi:MAG: Re/Si-specific NAD(P)(+) transhydrogenase subunit alpha [Bacteroidota bacterium]|nr:Re/Si-specific NAD(P)(+) transhydrogenase subunit alpha [Bacteroidota bacterium]
MIIGLLKDPPFEKRVALLPETVVLLKKLNVDILVETGAGVKAFVSDADYQEAGATVVSRDAVFDKAEVLVKINPFTSDEVIALKSGQVILAVLNPFQHKELVTQLAAAGITAFSLDVIPRISRAQSMDVLSSMATVAGYRAVLDAALHLPKFFPMFMSAAGTIRPAKVLILGAGVAGLQAVAVSRKLGAVVEVFDVRSAVKDEVQSLGGKFIEVAGAVDDKAAGGYAVEQTEEFKQKQRQLIHDHAVKANVVITTAQIPGKQAPVLLTKETVEQMTPGSVVVDMAASTGGNCEVTQNDQVIEHHGVTIIGKSDYPSDMPFDASKMFGNNVLNFLKLIISKEGNLYLNFEDDIVKGTCVTHDKQVVNDRVKQLLNL